MPDWSNCSFNLSARALPSSVQLMNLNQTVMLANFVCNVSPLAWGALIGLFFKDARHSNRYVPHRTGNDILNIHRMDMCRACIKQYASFQSIWSLYWLIFKLGGCYSTCFLSYRAGDSHSSHQFPFFLSQWPAYFVMPV